MAFAVRSVLQPSPFAPLHLLSARPIVLHALDWAFEPGAPTYRLLRALRDRRVDFLVSLSWYQAKPPLVAKLVRLEHRVGRLGDHRVTILASSSAELEPFRRAGLSALLVGNGALVDERIYRPLPGRRAHFDAVYDARLSSFKRHPLAAEVPNLALITYPYKGRVDPDYREAIEPLLARAHLFNGNPLTSAYRRLSAPEVNQALNRCAVGLALSREEGGMYASTQYLLAGLPVVSTPSRGGRDEFYHSDYVRIVDPDPRAVAAAVAEMRTCKTPPDEIRARTLATVEEHRRRLFHCVDAIYASQGCDRSFEAEWPALFVDKLAPLEGDETAAILSAIVAAHAG